MKFLNKWYTILGRSGGRLLKNLEQSKHKKSLSMENLWQEGRGLEKVVFLRDLIGERFLTESVPYSWKPSTIMFNLRNFFVLSFLLTKIEELSHSFWEPSAFFGSSCLGELSPFGSLALIGLSSTCPVSFNIFLFFSLALIVPYCFKTWRWPSDWSSFFPSVVELKYHKV